jgi:hypothetical protein
LAARRHVVANVLGPCAAGSLLTLECRMLLRRTLAYA